MIYVTCFDITGHTADELAALCRRATVRATGPMSDDQRQAARQLLEAFACFIDARVPVPTHVRMAVAALIGRGDEICAGDSGAEAQERDGSIAA